MDATYEAKYHQLEDTHWWFRGRRHYLLQLFRQVPTSARVLEIGCSGGPLMLALQAKGYTQLTGIDISTEGIALARACGLTDVYVMDAAQPTLLNGGYDLIIASDVLEHIDDQAAALTAWHQLLAPGGQLWVFVPAFEHLWSPHDVANHHYRRYTKRSLTDRLTESGFTIRKSSYWNHALYFPVALLRSFRSKERKVTVGTPTPTDDLKPVAAPLNWILYSWLRLENALLGALNFPVGVSVFALARKKD
jgi:SAM-dependent methyltransferase